MKTILLGVMFFAFSVSSFATDKVSEQLNSDAEVEKVASQRNKELLSKYNRGENEGVSNTGNKNKKHGLFYMNFTEESILDNGDIEVEILNNCYGYGWRGPALKTYQYYLILKNKTNTSIYVDLSKTFRIEDYRNYDKITETCFVSALCGKIVFKEKKYELFEIPYGNEIIELPPYMSQVLALPFDARVFYKHKSKIHEISVPKEESLYFTYDNSPTIIHHIVTYSLNKESQNHSTMKFTMFIKELIGDEPKKLDKSHRWIYGYWGSDKNVF